MNLMYLMVLHDLAQRLQTFLDVLYATKLET